jgi:hypothetical protein
VTKANSGLDLTVWSDQARVRRHVEAMTALSIAGQMCQPVISCNFRLDGCGPALYIPLDYSGFPLNFQ